MSGRRAKRERRESLRQFREVSEALMDSVWPPEGAPRSPAQVAAADQMEAADADRARRWRQALGRSGSTNVIEGRERLIRYEALFLSAQIARVRHICPHATGLLSRRGHLVVVLGQRLVACDSCLMEFVISGRERTDGRCDICDEPVPSGEFHAFSAHGRNIDYIGDAGPCCAQLVADVTHED